MHNAKTQRLAILATLMRNSAQTFTQDFRITQLSITTQHPRQSIRHCYRIAIQAQNKWRRQSLRRPAPAQRGRNRQRSEQMGCIAVTIKQPIQHCCPRNIAHKGKLKALLFCKAMFLRQDRQARINERQKANCQTLHHLGPLMSCLPSIHMLSPRHRRCRQCAGWMTSPFAAIQHRRSAL